MACSWHVHFPAIRRPAVSYVIPIEQLQTGECGCIHDIDGDPKFIHHLAEIGLSVGSTLTMLRPGSPCIIELNRVRVSLRMDELATILIELPTPVPR
jgi:ferrous iron transport protein A